MSQKWVTFYWLALLTLVVAGVGQVATGGFHVKRDLFSTLPEAHRDAGFLKAQNLYQERLGQKMIFAVTGVEGADLRLAMTDFATELSRDGLFEKIQYRIERSDLERFGQFYFPYRQQLLSRDMVSDIRSKSEDELISENLARIYSPVGGAQLSQLGTDPFGYYVQFLFTLKPDSNVKSEQGLLVSDYNGKPAAMAFASITENWQDYEHQLTIKQRVEAFKKAHPTLRIYTLGLSNYMRAGVERAQIEISTIGLGSLIGAAVLLLWIFRSLLPLGASVALLLVSVTASVLITHLVFGSIHFFTLILGSSLVGMIDDYSFHFFAQRFDGTVRDGREARDKVRKALIYSFLTTVIGFIFLFATPFPVLKQLGIFAIVGFVTAFLSIWTFYPLFPHKLSRYPKFWELGAQWTNKIHSIKKSHLVAGTFLLLILSGALMSRVEFSDDVRLMQSLPKDLKNDDDAIHAMLGREASQTYALVRGYSLEQVLEKEEVLRDALAKDFKTSSRAVSQWLPSQEQQKQSYETYKDLKVAIVKFYKKLKVPKAEIDLRMGSFEKEFEPITFDFLAEKFRNLPMLDQALGEIDGKYYSVLHIAGGLNSRHFASLNSESVSIVNLADDTSDIIKRLRIAMTWAAIAGWAITYLAIGFLTGFKNAVHIILSPTLAVLLSLGLTYAGFGALNLFHILAAILVFSLGIDYSFFFSDCEDSVYVPTLIAVVAAAITTGLSFGLMSLSQTAAISGFGLMIAIGITLSLILSPFAVRTR